MKRVFYDWEEMLFAVAEALNKVAPVVYMGEVIIRIEVGKMTNYGTEVYGYLDHRGTRYNLGTSGLLDLCERYLGFRPELKRMEES